MKFDWICISALFLGAVCMSAGHLLSAELNFYVTFYMPFVLFCKYEFRNNDTKQAIAELFKIEGYSISSNIYIYLFTQKKKRTNR